MRYPFALATSLVAFAYASAHNVRIYTFDSERLILQPRDHEVSPGAARLILSRRLEPSEASFLGQADGEVVKNLNEFGGRHSALLGALDKIDDISRLLVVLEGAGPYNGMS